MKRLIGYQCFVVAIAALAAFEYGLIELAKLATCANDGTPYAIAGQCSSAGGGIASILLTSCVVALASGFAAGTLLGGRALLVLWAALFVPITIGYTVIGYTHDSIAEVFYSVALVFAIMAAAPFLLPNRRRSTAEGEA